MLERFFNGECSSDEVDKIITSYYSGELSDDISESLKAHLKNPEFAREESKWDSKRLFEKITHDIYGEREKVEKVMTPSTKSIKKPSIYPFWLKIAASISILLVASFFVRQYYLSGPNEKMLNETEYVIKSTSPTERLTVRLEDGSEVILNTASKITYHGDFESHQRVIFLEGEAFFVVEKDKDRPFSVIANGINTTALGTSFNVNSKSDTEGKVEVALIEGSVKVGRVSDMYNSKANRYLSEEKHVILKPGEKLSIGPEAHELNYFNVKDVVGWKDGIIYFGSVPFEKVIDKLEKNYNVHFQVNYKDQEQKDQRYSGEFKNRSLEYILNNLSFSSDFTFEIEGDEVKIMFK